MKPGTPDEKVLPSRYSDYPLGEHDVFKIETPGGGGFGDPLAPASRGRRFRASNMRKLICCPLLCKSGLND